MNGFWHLLATPLGRLRIKVEEQVSPRFQRWISVQAQHCWQRFRSR